MRDQLDNLLDEAAKRELSLREALAFLVEREIARKDERRMNSSGTISPRDAALKMLSIIHYPPHRFFAVLAAQGPSWQR